MPDVYSIEIRHNFETAHRLASLGSPEKCRSIHGHSWWCTVRIEGHALDEDGILVEFGAFKRAWRGWLDDHLDHHLVLQQDDPVGPALRAVCPEMRIHTVPFNPTTEELARYLHERATAVLAAVLPAGVAARVSAVHIQETAVNAASWSP